MNGDRDVKSIARHRQPIGPRLAYHWEAATQSFWEHHWGLLTEEHFTSAATGRLGSLPESILKWLPRPGRILEAGCGPGLVVVALRARGYDAQGVELVDALVEQVRALKPDVPIRVGDVTALDFPDGAFGACISLGVCEHRQEGPEPFIREAHRLLRSGGVFIVSVPHYHWLRQTLFGRARAATPRAGLDFYQYAFTPGEFRQLLEQHGFVIRAQTGYGVWYGLSDDIPLMRLLERLPLVGPRLHGVLERLPFLPRWLGHMVLFVATKPL